jgi:rsbT co-antagonist protein RsbR
MRSAVALSPEGFAMRRLIAAFTHVNARSPDKRRRGRILVTICFGVVALLLSVGMGLTLMQPSVGRFVNLGLAVLVFTAAGVLGRKGFVGVWSVCADRRQHDRRSQRCRPQPCITVQYVLPYRQRVARQCSSPPRQIWIVLGVCLAALAGVVTVVPPEIRATTSNFNLAAANLTVLLIVSAFISFIGSQSLSAALAAADDARQRAEEANRQLEIANVTLESRVEERTAELRRLADEQRAAAVQMEESLKAQQRLNQMIAELSAPVIPVTDDTLIIPLIGNIDSTRVYHLLNSALQSIEQTRARTLIIDITGVVVIDSHVAAALVQVAEAARLMGAETILAGIRPEVAQTLIGLGAPLAGLRTAATLQAALKPIRNGR